MSKSTPFPQPIILASSSPRRRELLHKIGLSFEVIPSPFEETFDDSPPETQARDLSRGKVTALLESSLLQRRVILGADTVLDIEGKVTGKPGSEEEAKELLSRISGRSHDVITALTLYIPPRDGTFSDSSSGSSSKPLSDTETNKEIGNGQIHVETERTAVRLSSLSKKEIEWYVATGEWKNAAGGYRIQGNGALFVEHIDGCYFNIMGLPLHLFYGMVRKSGYELLEILPDKSSTV